MREPRALTSTGARTRRASLRPHHAGAGCAPAWSPRCPARQSSDLQRNQDKRINTMLRPVPLHGHASGQQIRRKQEHRLDSSRARNTHSNKSERHCATELERDVAPSNEAQPLGQRLEPQRLSAGQERSALHIQRCGFSLSAILSSNVRIAAVRTAKPGMSGMRGTQPAATNTRSADT